MFVTALGVVASGALGCGGTNETGTSSGGGGDGGSGGGGGSGGTGGDGLSSLDVVVGLVEGVPLPIGVNIRVLFNPPGGGPQQEVITDATGHAHFEGIDWSKGNGSLMSIRPNGGIHSLSDVNPENLAKAAKLVPQAAFAAGKGDAYLYAVNNPFEKTVTLSGKLLGAPPGSRVWVAPTVYGSLAWQVTGQYELQAPTETPFSLITLTRQLQGTPGGFESISSAWSQFDVAALSGSTTMNLDLMTGKPLTPMVASGTIELPAGAAGPFPKALIGYEYVASLSSSLFGGISLQTQPNAEGTSWSHDIEYVDIPGQTLARFGMVVFEDGSSTVAGYVGKPVEGETISDLLVPPVVTGHGTTLMEPITVEPVSGAYMRVVLIDPATQAPVWLADSLDTDVTSVTLPLPPEADLAKLPVVLTTSAVGLGITGYNPDYNLYLQASYSNTFILKH